VRTNHVLYVKSHPAAAYLYLGSIGAGTKEECINYAKIHHAGKPFKVEEVTYMEVYNSERDE